MVSLRRSSPSGLWTMLKTLVIAAAVSLVMAASATAQTAQATLAGEVRNPQGAALEGVRVFTENEDTAAVTSAITNAQGQYVLQFLPRGRYTIRVQAVGLRPIERRGLELHVAQRAVLDFQLEPLAADLQKQVPQLDPGALSRGAIGLIYGPDAQAKLGMIDDRPPPMTDATSSTVSGVVDEQRIHELPLAGRDVYTLFVLLPGVTSDNATQRGLGFSVNGFRASSSNYLLDGVDNNNVQNTSPVTLLSPDAIHEYRLATNNFSAEYGRGAFVANVVTRSGGNRWHGGAFEFLHNEKLNANSFQNNANSRPRDPFKEHQLGYTLGGPLRRDRLFLFTSLEALRASTIAGGQTVTVPSEAFRARVTGPIARSLLERFPALPMRNIQALDADRVRGTIVPHISINTLAASARADYDLRPDRDQIFVRAGFFDQHFGNVTFSPFRGLAVPFITSSRNMAIGHVHRFNAALVNEAKFALNRNENEFRPRAAGVPELLSNDGTRLPGNVASTVEQAYTDNVFHFVENLSVLLSRHHVVAGGEYRPTLSSSLLAPARIGIFGFADLSAFGADRPETLYTTVDRFSTTALRAPEYGRDYRQSDYALFVQDNWRLSRRLTLSLGLRYESFGVPNNNQRELDVNFYAGSGATPVERVASGALRRVTDNPGNLKNRLFLPDRNNFAPRFGFAFDALGNSSVVLRGGYGIYYDRVFNLTWDPLRLNNTAQVFLQREATPFRYVTPAGAALPEGPAVIDADSAFAVEPSLRTPYIQTWFLGVQHAATRNLLVEINHSGSLGRKLLARDIINRAALHNRSVLEIQSISNQGNSNFLSLQTGLLRRFSRGVQFQISHTWSHAIDNQGDPLVALESRERGFQREFDAGGDRGNADFDQRHNLVFNLLWQAPVVRRWGWLGTALSGWQIADMTGYRTGFPVNVISSARSGTLLLPRADYLGGETRLAEPRAAPGGKILLDRSRFASAGHLPGNMGRNALRGPGFWNYDLSVSRTFALKPLGETGRLQVRAEFFNAFNHANLSNPNAQLDSGIFGLAIYGRRGAQSLAVGSSPLNEFPRRIQMVMKVAF